MPKKGSVEATLELFSASTCYRNNLQRRDGSEASTKTTGRAIHLPQVETSLSQNRLKEELPGHGGLPFRLALQSFLQCQ